MSRERSLLTPSEASAAARVALVAAVVLAVGAWLSPARGAAGLLIANFYFASIALAALVFVAVQNVSSAGWPALLRRVPEAMSAYLPVGAAATVLLALAAPHLYPWAAPGGAAALGAKAAYLNVGWFSARSALSWIVWLVFARILVGLSRGQDATGDVEATRRAVRVSAGFLIAFALTFTMSSVDWLMSLEPKWTSTLYPWLTFAGLFETGLAALVVLTELLRRRGLLARFNEHHRHDLGKYLFAFSCFWAYLWFCQYLLIWYSNIPDETAHYVLRSSPGWSRLFWLNPIVNFVVPFGILLPARRKRRESTLLAAAAVILAGRALDLYLLVEPALGPSPSLGFAEPAAFVAAGALFVLLFDRAFASAAPEPARDPYIEESRTFSGV